MSKRENFTSRTGAILALSGSAIGLGNIWRFPYMVGENGGATFVLFYVISSLVLALPIFIAESVIGRRGGANCKGAMEKLAPGTKWKWLGMLAVITPSIIVSYYGVVGGWSMSYLWKSLNFSFINTPPEVVSNTFSNMITTVVEPIIFHVIFMLLSVVIVAFGVKSGIERFSKICMPVLFFLIIAIMTYSISLPGAKEGIKYLTYLDLSKFSIKSVAYALGQSFYSLSLGMGIVITYSSYVSKKENLMATGLGTAISDLFFAIVAGFAIMPAVFAAGIEPGSGPGLIFETLPFIFSTMGQTMPILSSIVAIIFFVTILFAALTSCISLIEVGVAYLIEEKGISRNKASMTVFLITFGLGLLCSLSFGPLSNVKIFGNIIFDFLDIFSSNYLLTIGGLMSVIFVGWVIKKEKVKEEFTNKGTLQKNEKIFNIIYFSIKYLAPILVVIIFIMNFL